MKKLIFLGLGSALIFAMGGVGSAQADTTSNTHKSTASGLSAANISLATTAGGARCASCHRAHTAKAQMLLKLAQPALCYSCHGDGAPGSSTDVVNGNDGGSGALRGGGFSKASIGSGLATKGMSGTAASYGIPSINQMIPPGASLPVTSKHLIGGTAADSGIAWGNGTGASGAGKSLTLECGSCHDPHGNGNYRILRPIPVDSGYATHVIRPFRAAVVDNPLTTTKDEALPERAEITSTTAGIKIPDVPIDTARTYTTVNYWLSGDTQVPVDATASYTGELPGVTPITGEGGTAPDGYIANVANWCTTCHTRYLATTKSYETNSGDETFMYKHRSDANYKAGAANCITCHVSHGSNAAMTGKSASVPQPGQIGTALGGVLASTQAGYGDSKLLRIDDRGVCVACHNV